MLTVTERASEYLREALTRRQEGLPGALRIVYTEEEGYHLKLDDPKEGDQVFEHDGQGYLVVDTLVAQALSDAVLDIEESPQGARITLMATGTPATPGEDTQSAPEPTPPSPTE